MTEARKKYGDIIDHPHFVSPEHPPMAIENRAAQFSPFAALTGYDDLVAEAARYTGERITLDESKKEELDRILSFLLAQPQPPTVSVTYFLPDEKKAGGAYVTVTGGLERFDRTKKTLRLSGGETIPIEDVIEIEAEEIEG